MQKVFELIQVDDGDVRVTLSYVESGTDRRIVSVSCDLHPVQAKANLASVESVLLAQLQAEYARNYP